MKAWIFTDETNRISASTRIDVYSEGMTEVNLPDDFDFGKQNEYRIENGELIYDPLPPTEAEKAQEEEKNRQDQFKTATVMIVNESSPNITDEQALTIPLLFYEWAKDTKYTKGQIIRHEDELYRIGQDHTSQEQWKPGDTGTTALYSHIKITEEGYEIWKAWDGVSGVYAKGQVVEDPEDGLLYESKIDNNTWGPPHSTPDYWDLYK